MLFGLSITDVLSDSIYNIEVPSTFKKDESKDYWQKEIDNEKISIMIYTTENKELLNLKNITEDDINNEKYLEVLKATFKKMGYKINFYSSDLKKTKLNNYDAIVVDVSSKYILESNTENIVYQRQYVLTSKNYIYYLIISSSDKSYLDKSELKNIINSFKINDELIAENGQIIKYYITLVSIITFGIVITVVFSKKK